MNINVPGLINAAVEPKDGKKRAFRVLADNGPNHNDPGFLSDKFPRSPPRLVFTAEDDTFDERTLSAWKNEGFKTEFLPMGKGGKEYRTKLQALSQTGLGPCETFGIVAYGKAASICLEHYAILDNNPEFKLGCLIAYYPTTIPDPTARYPSAVQVLVHLAGDSVGVAKTPQMVGIQGKRRVTRKRVDAGVGLGGRMDMPAFRCYSYDADPGFAEHDLDEYERIAAELAWSRSVAAARKAFSQNVDLEAVTEEHAHAKFHSRNLAQTLSSYTHEPSLTPSATYMPTLTGGIGTPELTRFYSAHFLPNNPPSLHLTLISRTPSPDRIVDELHASFQHTHPMPWILPGIPPTNRHIETMLVSIIALKGGKLYSERVYWDQAGVLLQAGLLSAKLPRAKARRLGIERLPVVGRQAARRVLEGFDGEEEGQADNALIPGWDDGFEDEEEEEEDDDVEGEGHDGEEGGRDDDDGLEEDKEAEEEEQDEPPKAAKQTKLPVRGGKKSSRTDQMSGGLSPDGSQATKENGKSATVEDA